MSLDSTLMLMETNGDTVKCVNSRKCTVKFVRLLESGFWVLDQENACYIVSKFQKQNLFDCCPNLL